MTRASEHYEQDAIAPTYLPAPPGVRELLSDESNGGVICVGQAVIAWLIETVKLSHNEDADTATYVSPVTLSGVEEGSFGVLYADGTVEDYEGNRYESLGAAKQSYRQFCQRFSESA